MKLISVTVAIAFLSLFSGSSAYSQVNPIGKDKVAIGGYDVVAYFVSGKATPGDPKIKTTHNAVIYYFSTIENQEAFIKQPTRYLPQYDGYCALAVGAQKKKVNINPETFKITNGKLYLFYNSSHALSGNKFNSLEPWLKDEEALIKKSNENWVSMSKKK
ncbi:YHS domain-containing (seleno)protein [Ohtaekwangia koreensis]|uniref:YHS domain-containing protein n=1 Tax=Ohtaekwangia koreensis TaxID=688867 RepID=A0A1T5J9M3_9BACT|nr:YHS domain-containing (seleno)protein [Ohtaekwangia koreensis]SKC47962.1 hypothetical protein SAMN05660236_0886 [Ohtaekwangia koreensis]